jgi:hypothetical protein
LKIFILQIFSGVHSDAVTPMHSRYFEIELHFKKKKKNKSLLLKLCLTFAGGKAREENLKKHMRGILHVSSIGDVVLALQDTQFGKHQA